MLLRIRQGTISEAIAVLEQVPELQPLYPLTEFQNRLDDCQYLILIAAVHGFPVGTKIGYERDSDGSFYSWLGGVLPEFRRRGIARALANEQEAWARNQGYETICVKTRRKHIAMLDFLKNDGFAQVGEIAKIPAEESRVLFEKSMI